MLSNSMVGWKSEISHHMLSDSGGADDFCICVADDPFGIIVCVVCCCVDYEKGHVSYVGPEGADKIMSEMGYHSIRPRLAFDGS